MSPADSYAGMTAFIREGEDKGLNALFSPGFNPEIARIYRNGYYRSVREVLAASFPIVAELLGEKRFGELTKNYSGAHPPRGGTLTNYGDSFPFWLGQQIGEEKPWLVDLARLDWAWLQCLHGKDATPVSAAEVLSAQDESDIRVQRLSNSRLLKLGRPVLHFWTARKQQQQIGTPRSVVAAEQWVIFWRPAMAVFSKELTASEARLLESLAQDSPFDTGETECAEQMASLFGQWLNAGLLQRRL